jgi:hypothetical protein
MCCSSGAHIWKAGPRIPAFQRLGSSVVAATTLAPASPAPTSSPQGSHCLQTWILCAMCLQQLLWLLEAHTQMKADPRASAALWTPDNSSPLALLPHRYSQFSTQYQEPTTTHLSGHQSPSFALLLAPEIFPPHKAWRPSTLHCP